MGQTGAFLTATRGQSETIGVVLLLGLTIAGAGAVVALGGGALTDMQRESDLQRAEHVMTQLDAYAAQVAIGSADVQTVDFGQQAGSYAVRPSAGTITVTHVNFDDATTPDSDEIDDGSGDDDEQVYTGSLGAVVYRTGETTIAYQGGGIWRTGPTGDARMVAPPEFHYREGTLTLPVVRTTGTASAAGTVTATIERAAPTVRAFPDDAQNYNDADPPDRSYTNPISSGYVVVVVQSEYYEGWAQYFRSRTDGTVTVDASTNTVKLALKTLGQTGYVGVPADQSSGGGSIDVRGLDAGHASSDFVVTIYPKDDQESKFNNLRWSMYVTSGNQKFEIALKASSADCGESVDLSVYYSPDAHTTYQGWTGSETVQCSDADGDGVDERSITLDMVDPDDADQDLTYAQVPGNDLAHYKNSYNQNDIQDPGDLGDHPNADAGNDHAVRSYTAGTDTESIDFVMAHYFAELGPTFSIQVEDQQSGGGAGVSESSPSSAYIDYEGGGRVVTYLHISENHIEVALD